MLLVRQSGMHKHGGDMLLKACRRKPNHLISVLNATQNAFFKERSWKIIGKFPVPVELNDSLNTTVRHLHLVWFQRYPIPWIIEQWKCSTWNTKAFLKEKCAFQGGRRFSWFCHQTLLRNFLIEISLYQVLHFTLIAKIKPNRQNTYQKFLDEVLSSFLEAGKN